jgi:lysophospholipase L1-like esterase
MRTDPNIRELSQGKSSTNNVTYIIVQMGTNNLASPPFIDVPNMKPLYDALLKSINKAFPYAKVLLLGIAPATITYPDFDARRRAVNVDLSTTYSNNPAFPYVKFGNCESYYFTNRVLDLSYFVDGVHFSPKGFGQYADCIKNYLPQLYA